MATEEIVTELFFGLVMALNLTNIMRVALIGQDNAYIVSAMTYAILGGNLAWGMADGVMNALSRNVRLHREYYALSDIATLPEAEARGKAKELVGKGLPRLQAELVDDSVLDVMADHLYQKVRGSKIPHPHLGQEGWVVLISTIVLNILSALPILAIYLFIGPISVNEATIIANIIGMAMLFALGIYLGRRTHGRIHLFTGLVMLSIGLAMVFVTVLFSGTG
jgi:VIT1/CCC1 family predicted Fe2+/Mn2+ transporter